MPRLSCLQDVIQSHAVRAVSALVPPTTQIPHLYSISRRATSRPPIVGQVQEEFRLPGDRSSSTSIQVWNFTSGCSESEVPARIGPFPLAYDWENARACCSPCSSSSDMQHELAAALAHSRPKCSGFWPACEHQGMQLRLADRSADLP